MAKQDTPVESETTSPAAVTPTSSPTLQQPAANQVQVDDSGAMLCYANFCRVTGTPEELILDFGLNSQPYGTPAQVEVKQRLVVGYFTAKRMLHALHASIQRHEQAFGVLEIDVQKRVRRPAETST